MCICLSAYILLVDIGKKDTLLSVLVKVKWILPVLSLDKSKKKTIQFEVNTIYIPLHICSV